MPARRPTRSRRPSSPICKSTASFAQMQTARADVQIKIVNALNELGDRVALLEKSDAEEKALTAARATATKATEEYIQHLLDLRQLYDKIEAKYERPGRRPGRDQGHRRVQQGRLQAAHPGADQRLPLRRPEPQEAGADRALRVDQRPQGGGRPVVRVGRLQRQVPRRDVGRTLARRSSPCPPRWPRKSA